MKRTAITVALLLTLSLVTAQDRLYHNTFNLNQVELLEGPFKHAMDLNVKVLLEYDTDRLLAPFLHEAGLPKKAEGYPGLSHPRVTSGRGPRLNISILERRVLL